MTTASPTRVEFDLIGSTVLVTGAAGGIGRAIVDAMLDAGARTVIAWDRAPLDHDAVTFHRVDLAVAADVQKALDELPATPSIVVNAAAFYASRPDFNVATEDFCRTLEVNLVSPFVIQRDIARRLLADQQQGAFINIASVAGKHGFSNQADYASSKAGLIGLTRAAALDLAPLITVNAIAPGTVDTPMIAQVIEDVAAKTGLSLEAQRAAFIDSIPTRRMQQPSEIAAAVLFLATTAARSITGEVINVDGGTTRD
ncbi:SDR family NAD(P)-dependent oxidoreductase [Streptomyces hokutonensis]|uniref:SDR family NAD(P)-dependent oxidoreductase n=1 Tax=Streptomyces hokutonensis TaxID=1306990 RepID=UPI0038056CE8